MTSKPQYEFSLASYRDLLENFTSSGWTFETFRVMQAPPVKQPTVIMRHDVDAELYFLKPFLEVEMQCAVKSTYFVMLESPLYNPFSPEGRRILQLITDHGHEIGLHFFGEIHADLDKDDLELEIMRQIERLSHLAARHIHAFSFHQPTTMMIDSDLTLPGVVNTYHSTTMSDFTYVSDTNMDWRSGDPKDLANSSRTNLQILTHPLWWLTEGSTPTERWKQVLKSLSGVQARHLIERERTLTNLTIDDLAAT